MDILTIINSAAMNIHVNFQIDLCFHFLLGVYIPRSGIAGSLHKSTFNFLKPNCVQIACIIFPFPPAVYEGSSCSIALPTVVSVHLLDHSYPSGCEVVPHCLF